MLKLYRAVRDFEWNYLGSRYKVDWHAFWMLVIIFVIVGLI